MDDPKKDRRYAVIDADGELYFYDDVQAYEAEVSTLGGDTDAVKRPVSGRSPLETGRPGPAHPPGSRTFSLRVFSL